jgi:hypothetical protein
MICHYVNLSVEHPAAGERFRTGMTSDIAYYLVAVTDREGIREVIVITAELAVGPQGACTESGMRRPDVNTAF